MQQDIFIKILDEFFKLFNFKQIEHNPPFCTPKKTLLILPDYIGDCVLLTPFIRNLKMNLPTGSYIDIVCHKPIANLLKTLPYIRNFYPRKLLDKMKYEFLQKKNYDTVFIFNYSIKWAGAAKKNHTKQIISPDSTRLGFTKPPIAEKVLTHTVPSTNIKDKTPQLKVNLNYLEKLGVKVHDYNPEIILTAKDDKKALDLIKTDLPKAYVHITAGSKGKEWAFNNWVEIVRYLKAQNFEIYVSGTLNEAKIYDNLQNKSGIELNNLCGKTSIRESIALLKFMDLVVTTDSAPAHFAAASKTPLIAVIYGPTNQYQWRPFAPFSKVEQIYLNLPCRPCLSRECANKKCLKDLSSDYVISRISNLLSKKLSSVKIY
ncbi:MAG: glycosyltransferase family 9 protein [Candidatus Gastranaerophilaceae bacterium]|jgi:ADP-heptose:LPS heptosyltransferase